VFLLDTNILSMWAPIKRYDGQTEEFREALERHTNALYLSVVTAAEIQDGIAKLFREGATRKASELSGWWKAVCHLYGDRILPFDLKAADVAGMLLDRARAQGHAPSFADVAIAATAMSRDLIIITQNMRHFRPLTSLVREPLEFISRDRADQAMRSERENE
jgi:predicted nucleic acid-binding protein